MRRITFAAALLFLCQAASADISLTDRSSVARLLSRDSAAHPAGVSSQARSGRAGKQAKGELTAASQDKSTEPGFVDNATGSITLIDSGNFEYFINTNITFATSSSASGAASEASYTGPVSATTSLGGTVSTTLNDAFDGYNSLCISTTGATGPCTTGNAAYTIYNQNGPATTECSGRQVVFPNKTIGSLTVWRKVLVPTDDQFIRWVNFVTNNGGASVSVSLSTSNNLGSDSNTTIVSSSDSDATAELTDSWVTTFQNYSGTTSSDPRMGHVLQGAGAPTTLASINFVNGDDNPYWGYTFTLAPGETKAIMNFATGQPSKAAAATKAAALALLPSTATQCLSATERSQIVNFAAASADLSVTKTTTTTTAIAGQPVTYTITASNAGPGTATNVTVTDTLPATAGFVSASGTGWTCGALANVVTCTRPTLAIGAAPAITLVMTAPAATTGFLSNTASISSDQTDSTPGNNSSTSRVALAGAPAVPTMSPWMLAMLALALSATAWIVTRRA